MKNTVETQFHKCTNIGCDNKEEVGKPEKFINGKFVCRACYWKAIVECLK